MTEEQAVRRVLDELRKREPDADWQTTDFLRPANMLMVVRIVLSLTENKKNIDNAGEYKGNPRLGTEWR